jgi:hypothetical protein
MLTLTTLIWIVGLTLLFEAVTCAFRFGLDLQSSRDTRWLSRWTANFRIHHGYVGAVMAIPAMGADGSFLAVWALRIGAALLLSDAIHHFLVLLPATGSHEFHITYPAPVPVPVEPDPDDAWD